VRVGREGEHNPKGSVPLTALFVSAAANAPQDKQDQASVGENGGLEGGSYPSELELQKCSQAVGDTGTRHLV